MSATQMSVEYLPWSFSPPFLLLTKPSYAQTVVLWREKTVDGVVEACLPYRGISANATSEEERQLI